MTKMQYKISIDSWDDLEKKSIIDVINSGQYSMGKKVKLFEQKFAKFLGSKYSVMVNSGSSANLIGVAAQFFLKKNKLKRGDEVIVPAIGWSTTYSPLQQFDLKLKIVDISLKDLNIDIDLLKKAITKKTKMICAVNLSGMPSNSIEIKKLCKKNKIIFYEDNCESLGSKIIKKRTGSFGDFGTHSFFFSHHMSTIEGGMVATDSFELYNILKCIRAHGWTRDLSKNSHLFKNNKKDEEFTGQYNFILPGFNVRPTEINASIGITQLKKIDKMIKLRRQNLSLFENLFANDNRFIIPKSPYFNSSFAFPLILKPEFSKLRSNIFKILKKNNIEFRLIAGGCFTKHPAKEYYNFEIYKNDIKNAEFVHSNGFWIGNYGKDLNNEIRFLYSLIKKI